MSGKIRIILCQLECHPAFYIDRLAFLEEPFVPEAATPSLGMLSSLGISGTVDLLLENKERYLSWHAERLRVLFSYPIFTENIPKLIVFPEGSIPLELLLLIKEFVDQTDAIVIAGTHNIQHTKEAKNIYKQLGKDKQLEKIHRKLGQVSFIMSGAKINAWKKNTLSIFERSDITNIETERIKLSPIKISSLEDTISLLPLVCADALQDLSIKGDYDLSTIISYTPKPIYFDPFIEQEVQKSRLCVYVNDGRFGGSTIGFQRDNRVQSWFFDPPLEGRMPQGDAIAALDILYPAEPPQVGIVRPKQQYELKLLSAITYNRSEANGAKVAKALNEIRGYELSEERYAKLYRLSKDRLDINLQDLKIEYLKELSRKGIDEDKYWDAYASDIILDLPQLSDIESEMSKRCCEELFPILTEDSYDTTAEKDLKLFLRMCKSKIRNFRQDRVEDCHLSVISDAKVIDREIESSEVLAFIDNDTLVAAQITGLPGIGKSSVIKKALSQSGLREVGHIEITNTTSAEYIIRQIAGSLWSEELNIALIERTLFEDTAMINAYKKYHCCPVKILKTSINHWILYDILTKMKGIDLNLP